MVESAALGMEQAFSHAVFRLFPEFFLDEGEETVASEFGDLQNVRKHSLPIGQWDSLSFGDNVEQASPADVVQRSVEILPLHPREAEYIITLLQHALAVYR